MPAVGMLVLGGFLGFVSIYALMKIEDWSNPAATLGGVIAAVLAVSVFTIFEVAVTPIGDAIYFYPIGLGFGALCAGMQWIGHLQAGQLTAPAWMHIGASTLAGVLILVLVFSPTVRGLLPVPTAAVATVAKVASPAQAAPPEVARVELTPAPGEQLPAVGSSMGEN